MQVYRDAKSYDAQYAGARQAYLAGQEKRPQGRAGLLPSLGLSASSTRTKMDLESRDTALLPSFERNYTTNVWTLTLTQPIYRPQNWAVYEEGDWQAKQAEAAFGQAGQDLILRVTKAYFDVLAAEDTLATVQAQKTAIAEQLAQAKRNFEVGTATITDTREAQARYDLVIAQEIVATNDLETKRGALAQLTGKHYAGLKPLRPEMQLSGPQPAELDPWMDLARRQSYAVQQQQAVAEVAQLEARRANRGHFPTLDFVATRGKTGQTGTAVSPVGSDITSTTVGLQLSLPIYQGGVVSSREREAAALMEKAREDLDQAKRNAALAAQQAYLGTRAGLAQVAALEQALRSSQSALESNQLGYQVGVRINIDVLNAQQQLYATKRDLAVARYNAITQLLQLKAAAASLTEKDLEEINQVLAP